MRNKNGDKLLNVYRYSFYGAPRWVAALTKTEAASLAEITPDLLSRVKGAYADGKPRIFKI